MANRDVIIRGYTADVAEWLDSRFRMWLDRGIYMGHEPIYGFGHPASEPDHFYRYARLFAILEKANCLDFESFVDVGGAEGFTTHLLRKLFGAKGINSDLSVEACIRGQEIFGVPGVAVRARSLPFADRSFDLVLCCEVIEHLEDPVAAIRELDRIARKYLIITTDHVSVSDTERMLKLLTRDLAKVHGERSIFALEDFGLLLGNDIKCYAQIRTSQQDCSIADPRTAMREILKRSSFERFDGESNGIVVVKIKDGSLGRGRWRRKKLVRSIFDETVPWDYSTILEQRRADGVSAIPFLRCPSCLSELSKDDGSLICRKCAQRFPIVSGVPRMYHVSRESVPGDEEDAVLARLRHKMDIRNILSSERDGELAHQCLHLLELQGKGLFPQPWEDDKIKRIFSDTAGLSVLKHMFTRDEVVAGYIDRPAYAETVSGTYTIQGWAINGHGVARAEIEIDGKSAGVARYGGERTDIAGQYPGVRDSLHSAFELEHDFSNLSPGLHELRVIVVSRSGSRRLAAKQLFRVI